MRSHWSLIKSLVCNIEQISIDESWNKSPIDALWRHSGCTYLHHKCICVVVSCRFWMARYSQKGKKGVQNLKNVIKREKRMQRLGNVGVNFLFIGWLTDWLIDWLIDWLTDWLIDWLIDWLTDWLIDWLIGWLTDWLINWLFDCSHFRRNTWDSLLKSPLA